eukprot:TRINITY_DN1547_c0_g1_i1.p1 TRINITY_DN1547_c0_g1~~TRINITY_DN1547_c0_g1_i1.p1  ORF type:complete len:110 (+),score=3.10 TRINITY_DN1547_c0_g1_i1:111-440(+)
MNRNIYFKGGRTRNTNSFCQLRAATKCYDFIFIIIIRENDIIFQIENFFMIITRSSKDAVSRPIRRTSLPQNALITDIVTQKKKLKYRLRLCVDTTASHVLCVDTGPLV